MQETQMALWWSCPGGRIDLWCLPPFHSGRHQRQWRRLIEELEIPQMTSRFGLLWSGSRGTAGGFHHLPAQD